MTILKLIDEVEVQGKVNIRLWNDGMDDYPEEIEIEDFEFEKHKVSDKILNRKIKYMFCVNNILIIEV